VFGVVAGLEEAAVELEGEVLVEQNPQAQETALTAGGR
jgi:hypothetical protein